jgi:hypothetical protein
LIFSFLANVCSSTQIEEPVEQEPKPAKDLKQGFERKPNQGPESARYLRDRANGLIGLVPPERLKWIGDRYDGPKCTCCWDLEILDSCSRGGEFEGQRVLIVRRQE